MQALEQELLVESYFDTVSLDSTIIHVHMHGTGARRTGGAKRSAALGEASGRPHLVMDRAYEDDGTRHFALELGYQPVVPPKSNRRDPHDYDCEVYQHRNEVERFFCRLKRFHRIDTRCDKLEIIFLATFHLVLNDGVVNSM